ncbi:hypothetical protein C8J56DRAFT_910668 [Mycena floridula]|nr:hypothetical protein C8J56DRAFT_910668 [Mycena floridula]
MALAPRFDVQLPESPFEHLLNSNVSTNELDTDSLCHFIESLEATVSVIETEISRVDLYRQELDDTLPLFEQFAELHRRLLVGACRRLPAEVLALIFMQCVLVEKEEEEEQVSYSEVFEGTLSDVDSDEYSVFDEFASDSEAADDPDFEPEFTDDSSHSEDQNITEEYMENLLEEKEDDESVESYDSDSESFRHPFPERLRTMQSPWMLTQVCSFWRTVALSLPEIWTNIVVDIDQDLFGWRKPSFALFQRQLQLSAFQPLSVQFSCTVNTASARQFLGELVIHSDRWEEANIRLPVSLIPILELAEGRLSLLRSVAIYFSRPRDAAELENSEAFATLEDCPSLRTTDVPRFFTLPWAPLTHITVQAAPTTLLEILALALAVEECDFRVNEDDSPTLGDLVTVNNISQLCRLYLSGNGEGTIRILDAIIAPKLETLSVLPLHSETDNLADPVYQLISRSEAPIRQLILRSGITYDSDAIVTLFEKIPEIEEMSIGIEEDFSFLNFRDKGLIQSLPKLNRLHLYIRNGELEKVVDNLEARYANALFLDDDDPRGKLDMELEVLIHIDNPDIDWEGLEKRLGRFQSRGLTLVLWCLIGPINELYQRAASPIDGQNNFSTLRSISSNSESRSQPWPVCLRRTFAKVEI